MSLRRGLDRGLTRPMTWLAIVFLLALCGALPQLEEHQIPAGAIWASEVLLLALWPLFMIEAAIRLAWLDRPLDRMRVVHLVAAAAIPPLRIGLTPRSASRVVWLPGLGWRRVGRSLARRLEKAFSGPMIVIALMILPVLGFEFAFQELIASSASLAMGLDIATRLIWLAFAAELTVMIAASPRKVDYCTEHWVDVAIVLFPLISFLRVLRVLRLGQVLKASRLASMARTYRLRGLAVRLLRALLLLRVLERLSLRVAEKRIAVLRKSIRRHRRQIAELEEEIAELEAHVAKRRAEAQTGAGVDDAEREKPSEADALPGRA